MTDRTEHATAGTDARPLVTFALFAFNQEQFVREAIDSALAQTYQPLEIILSDDGSTDRTFEIMEEIAAAYKGPHRIIARQSRYNLGTALHVYEAAMASSGSLFVVAAGDDISVPERVEVLVQAWINAGSPPGVVHSGRELFSDVSSSAPRRISAVPQFEGKPALWQLLHHGWLPAAAPTCAYTREIFVQFPPLFGGSIIEDAPLFLRAALIGKFVGTDEPLVRQRIHAGNSGSGYTIKQVARWNRFVQSKIVSFRTMQRDITKFGPAGQDERLYKATENHIMRTLTALSLLFLPEARRPNFGEILRFSVVVLASEAVSRSLRRRCIFLVRFFALIDR